MLSFVALTLEGVIYTLFDISNSLTSILSLTQPIQAFTPTNSITTAFVCQGHHWPSFFAKFNNQPSVLSHLIYEQRFDTI